MIKNIKLGIDCHLYDKNTNKELNRYDKFTESILVINKDDEPNIVTDSANIKQIYGGNIIVQIGDDRFILDDGYQPVLIRSGYITYNNYDIEKIENPKIGKAIKVKMYKDIIMAFRSILPDVNIVDNNYKNTTIVVDKYNNFYKLIISLDDVDNLINKNIKRKDNQLPFYPFKKGIDKYGNYHIAIFCERLSDGFPKSNMIDSSYQLVNKLMNNLVNIDTYHCEWQQIRKRILYYNNEI